MTEIMPVPRNSHTTVLRPPSIRSASLAKLGKGDNITTDVLLRIWEVMDCHIENILETTGE